MATLDQIKSGLIEKILTISNREFLEALDTLISTGRSNATPVKLSDAQKTMLEISEEDIKTGELISQEAMDKRNLEWLSEL
ncbi:hypothetical protein [Algoriphagus sp. A40]|uniref:hypothetical protein n=1 Tax=Algoriphagus sp. A40 TaxID=1945863 RepID=UPI00098708DC|nr:hypothetical protein [Algoriphagus sp. A40]OOG78298.1 hypothetical protein B0E43_02545 [Algoriphagus sp. A40]